jgi:murein L,D-transpeptidase YcbB/YkuD
MFELMFPRACFQRRRTRRVGMVRVATAIVSLLLAALAVAACSQPGDVPRGATDVAVMAPDAGRGGIPGRGTIAVPRRGRFILVNIPAFELLALEDGSPVLRSRIIVGRPAWPTPELLSSMYAVTFNPSWTPTPAMVRREGARPIAPGPHNPLGQLLFELDNDELIYLHDTNDRSLFGRPQRALSHGCIRVEQARALAAWALSVSEAEVAATIAKGATRSLPLAAPIPVLLAYHTTFPDENGRLRIFPDIYGREKPAL